MAKANNSKPATEGNHQNNGAAPAALVCTSKACKTKPTQFGFCPEHFQQYKFGLINKKGENVPDYEKKIGHYQEFLAKKNSRKVA